jgi:hypothetical protein
MYGLKGLISKEKSLIEITKKGEKRSLCVQRL